ncbi:MAG: YitT family protein [Ruminococcaceae bacterium]|nr:YitT family protein [Oscillospiraceae bacterium]
MRGKVAGYAVSYLKIILGAALYAAGFRFFLYPNAIVSGGVTGAAMIINYLTGVPVGVMTIIINIPLFAFSWKKFGLKFILASLVGMMLSSVLVDLFALFPLEITHEPLLGAIYGGLIKGLGLGLVYQTGATTGGIDIVAKFLRRKYPYVNFSTFILGLDVVVIAAFAVFFGKYDGAMCAVIAMFVATKVIDLLLYGAVNSKVCYVISDESEAVKNAIIDVLGRGVTFLHGEGAWTHKEKNVILCVIKQQQIVELRRIVERIDEKAFMIVSDSREVFGKGFSYIGNED